VKKHFLSILMGLVAAFFVLMLIPKIAMAATSTVTYSVPVADALKPYAQFTVPAHMTKTATGLSVSYLMPEELVGPTPVNITLNSTDYTPGASSFTLSGPQGQATCQKVNDSVACNIQFSALNIDSNAVEANLRQKVTNPEELDNRLLVGRIFSADPVGVLTYTTDDSSY